MAMRIAAFVIPLGLDTFAVAVPLGLRGVSMLRPAVLFPVFEMAMPLVGIALGYYVRRAVEDLAGYLGAMVLIGIGIRTLQEVREGEEGMAAFMLDSVRGMLLAGLAISTDEIAMGFPLGAFRLPVGLVLPAIGAQALVVTVAGMAIGRHLNRALGRRAARTSAVLAGVAFLALGGYLGVENLLGARP